MDRRAEITPQEEMVTRMLAAVWDAYCALPIEHPTDQSEFCAAIHRCQDMVLARPGRRYVNRSSPVGKANKPSPSEMRPNVDASVSR